MPTSVEVSLVDLWKLHGLEQTRSSRRVCGFLEGEGEVWIVIGEA